MMQTKSFLYWSAQFGGWLTYGVLVFLATYADNPSKLNFNLFMSISIFISCGIIFTHLMRNTFIKLGFLDLKLSPLIPRILFFSILTSTLMALVNHFGSVFLENEKLRAVFSLKFVIEIIALWLLILLWNAIYFTYHFFKKSINQELYVLQMQASKNEIELKSLRSQINPHFLFNSLNSIRALIEIEPKLAKDSITSLSNLLRKSLVQGKNSFISLEEEIELVKNYLDLEKIRFEERLTVDWFVNQELLHFEIPPFIIHTQVENAIKHGISKLIDGGKIEIEVTKNEQKKLQIKIRNTGNISFSTELNSTGIGIENTKRRLDLQYNGRANFDLREMNNQVVCTIEIEINDL
jgi:two-component system, LytTR family, sensor kinase